MVGCRYRSSHTSTLAGRNEPLVSQPEEFTTEVQHQELVERVASLETRLAALEGRPTAVVTAAHSPQKTLDATELIQVQVLNKRFDKQQYQEYIWFDCVFTAVGISRPTRAAKGNLEFCDLFAAPQFVIGYTLNEEIEPQQAVSVQGIGFQHNEFLADHQWMLTTPLDNMKVRFRVQQVLYADGSTEDVA
jgi:hypothetical protein